MKRSPVAALASSYADSPRGRLTVDLCDQEIGPVAERTRVGGAHGFDEAQAILVGTREGDVPEAEGQVRA